MGPWCYSLTELYWTIVDTIHSKRNKFVTGVKIKVTADSKPNNSSRRGFEYFLDHTVHRILVNLNRRLTVLKKEMNPRLIMKYVVANHWHIQLQFDEAFWVPALLGVITLLSTVKIVVDSAELGKGLAKFSSLQHLVFNSDQRFYSQAIWLLLQVLEV